MRRHSGSGSQGGSDEIDDDEPGEGARDAISDELDERLAEAWEQLDAGDVEGARARGEQLAKEVPDAPEAPFLLAACASEAGEDDQALALLDRAVALDPGWAEPELRAAELLADRGDIDGALARATAAQLKAEEDESEQELLDSLALKAGLELELDKPAQARRTLSALPSPQAVQAPGELLRELAHLQLAVDNFNGAEAWFQQAIAADGQDADAWHGLGLASEAAGDEEGKREAWLKTLALDDRDDPEFQEHLTEAQMAEVAEAALAELPARARGPAGRRAHPDHRPPRPQGRGDGPGSPPAGPVRRFGLPRGLGAGGHAPADPDPAVPPQPGARGPGRGRTARGDPHHAAPRNRPLLRHVRTGPARGGPRLERRDHARRRAPALSATS